MQEKTPGFKETITWSAEAEKHFSRQTSGRNLYAMVRLKVEPLKEGEDILFVNALDHHRLSDASIQAVEDGVREVAGQGIRTRYPLVRLRVTLLEAIPHPTDSSAIAFKIAGMIAFKEAVRKAHPVLLEPVMLVQITTPSAFLDKILGDLKLRRGTLLETQERDTVSIIRAQVKQSYMSGYEAELGYLTSGQTSFAAEFSHSIKTEI